MSHSIVPARLCQEAILAFAAGFLPFHPYRNHSVFPAADLINMLQQDLGALIDTEDMVAYVLLHRDEPIAVCAGSILPWDSQHFGERMAKLECHCRPDAAPGELLALVRTVLAAMTDRLAPQHIACHVDADCYGLFNALSQNGFLLQDAKRTYVARSTKPLAGQKHRPFAPREYQDGDRDQVLTLFDSRRFSSRFTRDESLDARKAAELYSRWALQLIELPPPQRVLHVVERQGVVLAVGGVKNIDLAQYGITQTGLGDGVFACQPRAAGSYGSVLLSLIEDGIRQGYDFLETKVSLNNRPATRVLEYIGADAVTCHYALHWRRR